MAFEIGERVTSRFTGAGTVIGEIFKIDADADGKGGVAMQRVKFDSPMLGEKDWAIQKLNPTEDGGDIGV